MRLGPSALAALLGVLLAACMRLAGVASAGISVTDSIVLTTGNNTYSSTLSTIYQSDEIVMFVKFSDDNSFVFPFYGREFTYVYVGSNGFLTFSNANGGTYCCSGTSLPSTSGA